MHGHWDIPRRVLGVDGFQVGSKYYMYFGVWPSVLRMPLLAVAGSLSGKLTVPSMLLAFTVLLTGAAALYWRIRSLVSPDRGCSRGEAAIAGAAVFTIGCGTTALFLASRAYVYHEAILWAAAWSLLAYERIIAFTQRPSRARLGLAALFATLTILSRVSIGLGPVIALGVLAAIELIRIFVRRRTSESAEPATVAPTRSLVARLDRAGVRDESARGWFLATTAAVVVPVVGYVWMNLSRFGSPFGIPWRSQVIAQLSPAHRAMLNANGGSLFGIKLIPTTLVQAVRPDAVGWSSSVPVGHVPALRHIRDRRRGVQQARLHVERDRVDAGPRAPRCPRGRGGGLDARWAEPRPGAAARCPRGSCRRGRGRAGVHLRCRARTSATGSHC